MLSETFQVAAMIEKLPPSWIDFKNYLKHKRKEMTIEDLVVRLCIEDDNKIAEKKSHAPDSAKANIVEHGQSSKDNKSKGRAENNNKGKGSKLGPKGGVGKKKFQGTNRVIGLPIASCPRNKPTWLMMLIILLL